MEQNKDEHDNEHSKFVHLEEESSTDMDHNIEEFDTEDDKAMSSCRYIATDDVQCSKEIEGGSKFWIPKVEDNVKPIVGSVFPSLDKAIEMYASYAEKGGFKIRRSTQKKKRDGTVVLKYILCSKAGVLENTQTNTLNQKRNKKCRKMELQRTGCNACVKFKLIPDTSSYQLYSLEDKHNHTLVVKDDIQPTKKKRPLDRIDDKANDRCDKLAHEIYSIVDDIIGKLWNDKQKLALFLRKLRDLKNEIETDLLNQRAHEKDVIGSVDRISKPEVVAIRNVTGIRNEGCSTEKKSEGPDEKAVSEPFSS